MLVGVPLQPTAAATSAAGFLLENRGNALGRASKARAPDIMGAVVAAVIERFLPTGSWLACRLRASSRRHSFPRALDRCNLRSETENYARKHLRNGSYRSQATGARRCAVDVGWTEGVRITVPEGEKDGLADALDLGAQDQLRELAGAHPKDAARRFHQRVEQAGVTIGRQQLQCLQAEGADKCDCANQKYAPRVR